MSQEDWYSIKNYYQNPSTPNRHLFSLRPTLREAADASRRSWRFDKKLAYDYIQAKKILQ